MNRDEYNELFHKVGLNRVAFKAVNDCDEEILVLVNAAIAAEREECAKVCDEVEASMQNGKRTKDGDHAAFTAGIIAERIRARGQS